MVMTPSDMKGPTPIDPEVFTMRVFVTGASGHIASAVIPELLSHDHQVVALARSDSSAAAVEALGAEVRRGDLADLDGLRQAASEADGVIHLAFDHAAMRAGQLAEAAAGELAAVNSFGDALAEPTSRWSPPPAH